MNNLHDSIGQSDLTQVLPIQIVILSMFTWKPLSSLSPCPHGNQTVSWTCSNLFTKAPSSAMAPKLVHYVESRSNICLQACGWNLTVMLSCVIL